MIIKEVIKKFFHKPDESQADMEASQNRMLIYRTVALGPLCATPIVLPFIAEVSAQILQGECYFLIWCGLTTMANEYETKKRLEVNQPF